MKTTNNTDKVSTLIITVGTRQIGWRCKDGVIRSFGADGNIGYPAHVNELYQELGIERGNHQEGDKVYPWSGRDLGKRYYDYCKEWLGRDFSNVELLLDKIIIETAVNQGLKHIILWATDQPEDVSWFYRRLDTLYLAELIKGKIKSLFPDIRVDIHAPKINANDTLAIREELEQLVLKEALDAFYPQKNEEFTLWIQNKGCAPAVASCVEICAAALVRQCKVYNASPDEPPEFFSQLDNGLKTANHSQSFQLIPMGEYFWALEKVKIKSAWERGDFAEAQIWLKVHQTRHSVLYKLAGFLAQYSNWESNDDFYRKLKDWVGSKDVLKLVNTEQIEIWKTQLQKLQNDKITNLWESTLILELTLNRENYTTAFIQFVQILEQLLYLQSINQKWYTKGWIPKGKDEPTLAELMQGWCLYKKFKEDNKWSKLMGDIRQNRNQIIHEGESVNAKQVGDIWAKHNFEGVKIPTTPEIIKKLMINTLKEISTPPNFHNLLMRSLYQWGLQYLEDAS
ncbi:hypothetical protein H6G54_02965 [Anabaena cylindrica FACHB-243]|uniref:Apea-like HEPN domain-containing protein n=1 Tax=Anabaena cylindrica (strain ATCC 27899 / PCC 7122) TaxID=272123 RepID=K9ZPV2_ANACC|nr:MULTISPECIES: hypothetical protein [Anabaena]AFZ61243.1 hypothetical protein Anacy_5960 [Anabaena cylindrica PCC 7122]MBD2416685.1 hypothetical protein [Anabaena cylindrica FACHB-243]MBY5284460.1 hypothetical protein [Anabaena sp. CCAP 1446/1C]MBY5311443.1 hypothetical protein [Anabaena sp. CCAP 1446/1C]MCM2408682.1 hypothetical protein [Anabaena sp. CCAP 1446/1C]